MMNQEKKPDPTVREAAGEVSRRRFLQGTVATAAGALALQQSRNATAAGPDADAPLLATRQPAVSEGRAALTTVANAYDYDVLPPLAMLKNLSRGDLPSKVWLAKVAAVVVTILQNGRLITQASGAGTDGNDRDAGAGVTADSIRARVLRGPDEDAAAWILRMFDLIESESESRSQSPKSALAGATLAQYNALFQAIPLPAIAGNFQTDASFAYLRVAGPNPTVLSRVPEAGLPANFPVTDQMYRSVLGDDALALALSEGRLYIADYAGLEPLCDGTFPSWQKYAFEPIALFAVPRKSAKPGPRLLVPVAIQCGQEPAGNPIIIPSDGDAWLAAKTVVQIADGNHHELIAHLGRTHLLVEPFAIATPKWLNQQHPLRRLLEPHLEGTRFINWAAGKTLITPKGTVDKLLSGTIDADRCAAVRVTASRTFDESFLPEWLAAQGLDDLEKLPVFPFRDDAMLLWDAIGQWANAYVALHWPADEDVRNDVELQAWARDLAAFHGGRVAGFGDAPAGGIRTAAYLAGAVQMIIFTASAMHAAVNFPQADIMSYAPAMPLAGYTAGPAQGTPTSREDWLRLLPPIPQALAQLNLGYLLGSVHYTVLGLYGPGHFSAPAEVAALRVFQRRLLEITAIIGLRNRLRAPYPYLSPDRIPQSINI